MAAPSTSLSPMTWWQALLIGILQGATELFPVSSLGHAVLVPSLLRWSYRPSDPTFLPFLTLLHLGTAGALLLLYRREWALIAGGFVRASVRGRIESDEERLAMLILAGTVPAGIVGVVLEPAIKSLFGSARSAGAFLAVNGLLLLGFEMLRRRDERRHGAAPGAEDREAAYGDARRLRLWQVAVVGGCQALALVPGISRSGITIGGGLLAGLRHDEAARFSFLLATPVILGAGILEVPQLATSRAPLGLYVVAAILAGGAAYVSATYLVRYFRSGRLTPYAIYCIAAGALALALVR